MIRFPYTQSDAVETHAFNGTTLAEWLSASSVYELLCEASEQHATRTALTWIGSGEPDEQPVRVSYAEFMQGVTQAANLFRHLGVQRDNVVAYMLPALVDTQYVLWGAETAGIASPINFLLQPAHIAELLHASGTKVLVALGPVPAMDIWQKALQVRELIPELILVQVGGAPVSDASVVEFDTARRKQQITLGFADRPARNDVAAYFHTGGTTGQPKLVTHTHENQLAAAYGGAVGAALNESDVITNGFPMFHVAGTIFCSLSHLLAGAEVLILSAGGFRNPSIVKNFWRIVERHRVTIAGAVPTAIAAILEQPATGIDVTSLRVIMSGAAALPLAVAQKAESITGRQMCELLGMTETGGVSAVDSVRRGRVLGSAGYPIVFAEMQTRRMHTDGSLGELCAADEMGVFVIRGPNVTPGYKNPQHNSGAFSPDGWLVTGDLGYLDRTGRVFLTGRAKDLIIRSGHNIDPAMIEDAFLEHPDVSAAAAVAMPDAYAGELPVAFVVLKAGKQASPEDLQAFVETRINERPAFPKRIYLVDALPVTGVGKVFKPALRNDCAQRLFAEILDGEPFSSLSVSENTKRGRLVEIALDAASAEDAVVQKRIVEKLAGHLVSVAWTNADLMP